MNKKLFLILLLLGMMIPAVARGAMSGEQDVRVVRTEWFDFIFPSRSEPLAQHLAARADQIYRDIAADYGQAPQFRMPVVITPAIEQHNGYFSQAFYNHIVIYDAPPTADMDIFSDSIVSTFTHELTHAYTYNMKNGFWKGVGTVFGDTVNPGHLLITRGWAEGATLTMESRRGEGRMNSGYSLQMVRQAAIEGKFPAYADVQGARTSYPAGSFYNFNGGFNQWLQDKYGMEKYAQFWYRCINLKGITAGQVFKKVYGLKLNRAWGDFRQQVETEWSHLPANPLTAVTQTTGTSATAVRDFFQPTGGKFSARNREGALFTSLVSSEQGLFWLDAASSTVYHCPNPAGTEPPKVERVAAFAGIQKIAVSADGRFLAAEALSQGKAAPKVQLWILDRKEGGWSKVSSHGRELGGLVTVNGEPVLVATEYSNGSSRIQMEQLIDEDGKIRTEALYQSEFHYSTFYRDFVDLGGGRVAFIKSQQGKQSVQTATVLLQSSPSAEGFPTLSPDKEFLLAEASDTAAVIPGELKTIQIRNLSFDRVQNRLLFSWAAKNTLPRLGTVELADGKILLQDEDISGGVHFPVPARDGNQQDGGNLDVAFIGNFYTENRLLRGKFSLHILEGEQSATSETAPDASATDKMTIAETAISEATVPPGAAAFPASDDLSPDYLPSQAYNPFRYYRRGVFLPLPLNLATPLYGNPARNSMLLPVGLTWMSSNPWLMGMAIASVGYGIDSKSLAYHLSYQNGTHTNLFQYNLSHGSEFNLTGGWLHSTATAGISSTLPLGRISRVSLGNTARFQFGRVPENEPIRESQLVAPGTPYFHLINSAAASWSNLHQWGSGRHEQLGLSVGAEVYYTMNASLSPRAMNGSAGNLGLAASFYVPKLIPIRNVQHHTYNLPTSLHLRLFTTDLAWGTAPDSGGTSGGILSLNWGQTPALAASVEAETILYSVNIQKALPVVTALFVNGFSLSLRGTVGFGDLPGEDGTLTSWRLFKLDRYFRELAAGNLPLHGNVAVRANFDLTPNVGFSAYPGLGGSLFFEFTTAGLEKAFSPVFRLGLTANW